MYADYFLKFADEAEANALLYTPAPEPAEGEEPNPPTPHYANIDTLGILYDEDGEPMDGWHVNVRLVVGAEDPAPFAGYEVFPAHPRRVWAGPMYPVDA
jgi:hypothetical protein